MTPGQVITAGEITAAVVIAGIAAWRWRWAVAEAALAILLAVALMRLFKAGLPPDLCFVAWAALWTATGAWVVGRAIAASNRAAGAAGGFCIISGLIDGASWLVQPATTLWSVPVMVADLSLFAALAALFWGACGGRGNRILAGQRPFAVVSDVVRLGRRARTGAVGKMDAPEGRQESTRR